VGVVVHPAARWWLTAEAATAPEPAFAPKNAWEANVTALVARGASAGVSYRRQNYASGPVDILIPHTTVDLRRVTWEIRVFVSRNPSQQTDVAGLLRATFLVGGRTSVWVGAGAGRESYVTDTLPAQEIRSLETITALVGMRYTLGRTSALRLDLTVVRSEPVLSRRGLGVSIETGL
jgi:YaiO family outer membrane protein